MNEYQLVLAPSLTCWDDLEGTRFHLVPYDILSLTIKCSIILSCGWAEIQIGHESFRAEPIILKRFTVFAIVEEPTEGHHGRISIHLEYKTQIVGNQKVVPSCFFCSCRLERNALKWPWLGMKNEPFQFPRSRSRSTIADPIAPATTTYYWRLPPTQTTNQQSTTMILLGTRWERSFWNKGEKRYHISYQW